MQKKQHLLLLFTFLILLPLVTVIISKSFKGIRATDSISAQVACDLSAVTFTNPQGLSPNLAFTKDCIANNKALYTTDARFTFFQVDTQYTNLVYIKTPNTEIKSIPLDWTIQVPRQATIYIFNRHIPGLTPPDWITSQYVRSTNDDLSNINQYLLRKNEDGLIGLYDVYSKTVPAGTVRLQEAGNDLHQAYSMYLVAVKVSPTTPATNSPVPTNSASPTASPVKTNSPSPSPVASSGTSPSGQSMPVGDLPGWKQIFTEDFKTNVAVGGFPGAAYDSKWDVYNDGWPDSAGKRGKPSRYYPSKVISVKNGVLNKFLHSENGISMGAAILPVLPGHTSSRAGQRYGKYTVRFKSEPIHGFKTAWLQWPDSGVWPRDGEIDFPEGDLDGTIKAFMHRQNATTGGDQDAYSTGVTYTSWHTASLEWGPTVLKFILDDKVIGTSTSRIPNTSMHWVLQTESCYTVCPAANATANLQIDWVTVYSRL